MNKITVLSTLNWALAILLLILAFGSPYISEHGLLQQLGRFHPLMVHLPIGIWVLCAGLFIFFKKIPEDILAFCLQVGAASAILSAIVGIFLVTDSDYTAEGVWNHKWLGVAFAITAYITSWRWIRTRRFHAIIMLAISTILLTLAGHHGGNLTHGDDFLFPEQKEDILAIIDADKSIYENFIFPIFDEKCVSCHKVGKSKGELNMTDTIAFLTGGETGIVLDREEPLNSELLSLIHLPMDDDRHMPPDNKSQLSKQEKTLISEWVKAGSSFYKKLGDYDEQHALYTLVKNAATPKKVKTYTFEAASGDLISELNTDFCTVQPLNQGSPALSAQFYVASQFDPNHLSKLEKVKDQLVSLSLHKMPLTDIQLATISNFPQLEQLFLNETKISEAAFQTIQTLKNLELLSIAGTEISSISPSALKSLSNLEHLFLSDTKIDSLEIKNLQKEFPNIVIDFAPRNNEIVQLTPPQLAEDEIDIDHATSLQLTNIIQGTDIYFSNNQSDDKSDFTLYNDGIPLSDINEIRAFSSKKGWTDSEYFEFAAFKKGIKPDSISLNLEPNKQYNTGGSNTLRDNIKGEAAEFRTGKWLGYLENGFSATCYFNQPKKIEKVVISYGVNVGAYIVTPRQITLDINGKRYVKKIPEIAQERQFEIANRFEKFELDSIAVSKIDIDIKNEQKLPSWHQGSGQKGWFFIDEIYFY